MFGFGWSSLSCPISTLSINIHLYFKKITLFTLIQVLPLNSFWKLKNCEHFYAAVFSMSSSFHTLSNCSWQRCLVFCPSVLCVAWIKKWGLAIHTGSLRPLGPGTIFIVRMRRQPHGHPRSLGIISKCERLIYCLSTSETSISHTLDFSGSTVKRAHPLQWEGSLNHNLGKRRKQQFGITQLYQKVK